MEANKCTHTQFWVVFSENDTKNKTLALSGIWTRAVGILWLVHDHLAGVLRKLSSLFLEKSGLGVKPRSAAQNEGVTNADMEG